MRLEFTGRQMEITPDLREYTQKQLKKVTRVLRGRFDVHAILTAEKHRRIAEITLTCRDHVLVGVEETGDILASSMEPSISWNGRQFAWWKESVPASVGPSRPLLSC
jgi:ribosomal subunit interface protein